IHGRGHMTTTDGRLAGKVGLVTGGASGIGRATVRRFVAEGARVVAGDRDEAGLAAPGDTGGPGNGDVPVGADAEALAETAVERFGRLDVAFANAGTGSVARLADCDLAEWQRVLDVNLNGPFLTVKHAARRMGAGGSIVITGSLNSVQAGVGM